MANYQLRPIFFLRDRENRKEEVFKTEKESRKRKETIREWKKESRKKKTERERESKRERERGDNREEEKARKSRVKWEKGEEYRVCVCVKERRERIKEKQITLLTKTAKGIQIK